MTLKNANGKLVNILPIFRVESTSNRCHNFRVDSPFKIDEIPMNFLRVISTPNRWLANKDVPIRFALSNICKRLISHTQKPGADPGIILECCKILQKKIITIR